MAEKLLFCSSVIKMMVVRPTVALEKIHKLKRLWCGSHQTWPPWQIPHQKKKKKGFKEITEANVMCAEMLTFLMRSFGGSFFSPPVCGTEPKRPLDVAGPPALFCWGPSASGGRLVAWNTQFFRGRRLPTDTEGSCGLEACFWGVGSGDGVTARLPV